MNPDELDRLIHRYFERDLSSEEESLLAMLIRTDPKVADRFVELSEMESAMVESLKAEEAAPPDVSTPMRGTRRRTKVLRLPAPRPVWPLLFAAGLMIGFVALLLQSADRPTVPAPVSRGGAGVDAPALPTPPVRTPERPEPRRADPATAVDDFVPPVFAPVPAPAPAPSPATPPETPREEKREPARNEKPVVPTDVKVAEAKIEKVEGDAVRIADASGPVATGQALPSGQGLEVRKGLAVLALADGTRVELRAGARLERMVLGPDQKRFELTRGALSSTVAKQPAKTSVVFMTPHAEVAVIGTKLSVEIGADATRVEVQEGRVRCTRLSDKYHVDIPAGRYAMAGKGASPSARPTPVVRAFQDGVSPTPDYAGTLDTWISSAEPSKSNGSVDQLNLQRLSESRTALIRWDIASIPPGSKVLSAEVSFWVTGKLGGDCKVHPMLRGWDETATWKSSNGSASWFGSGAQGNMDRGLRPIGLLAPEKPVAIYTMPLNELGIDVVQAWVNDPKRNFGIAILGPDANMWGLDSREVAAPERRPKLTVTYLPAK